MIVRIIGRRIDRKAARRAMLETLIDRQDNELAGTTELAVRQDAGKIRLGAGVVALIPGEDVLDGRCEGHDGLLMIKRSRVQYPSRTRSEEHTSELQSLMRISYAVFCLKKKNKRDKNRTKKRHQ